MDYADMTRVDEDMKRIFIYLDDLMNEMEFLQGELVAAKQRCMALEYDKIRLLLSEIEAWHKKVFPEESSAESVVVEC